MPQVAPQLVIGLIFIQALISALFCFTIYRTLMQVRESNRTMRAGLVWLLMIPGFEKIWSFRVFTALSSSLVKEFTDRDFEINERPGLAWGLTYASLSIVTMILMSQPGLPGAELLVGILSIIGIIAFVQYWVKISWYRKVLEDDQNGVSDTNSTEG